MKSSLGRSRVVACSVVWLAACGTNTEGLFGGGDGAATGAGNAAGEANAGGLGSTTNGAGNTGNEGNTANTGIGGNGAGGAPTTSGGGDTTSGGGSPAATLDCGETTCALDPGSACCWDNYELTAPPKAACVSTGTEACNNSVSQDGLESVIECQLPSHCGSGICCAHRQYFVSGGQTMSFYPEVVCENTCAWPDILLCDPLAPACPDVDMDGDLVPSTCIESQLLPPGYYVCSPS